MESFPITASYIWQSLYLFAFAGEMARVPLRAILHHGRIF